jgi:phosphatidylserine/phosphatidylglycerophosphate/cardiolipin synthase-like enzyme
MLTSLVVLAILSADGGTAVPADAGIALGPCSTKQTICFSPKGECDKKLVALIDTATKTLEVLIYSVNLPEVVDAITRAKARGVVVRMIVDTTQLAQEKEIPQVKKLADTGVPMKRDGHSGIMHMKVIIVDDTTFETGSFNFTNGAANLNNENMLIWSCPRNALIYKQEFERLWATFKPVVLDGGL